MMVNDDVVSVCHHGSTVVSGQCIITGRPFGEDDRRFASVPSVALASCCDDPSVRSAVVRRPALPCQTQIPTALSDCRDFARRVSVSHLTGSLLWVVVGALPPPGLDPRPVKTPIFAPPGGTPSGREKWRFLSACGAKSRGGGGAPPTTLILLRNQRPRVARPPHAYATWPVVGSGGGWEGSGEGGGGVGGAFGFGLSAGLTRGAGPYGPSGDPRKRTQRPSG